MFIDGCYWYGCPACCRPARTNAESRAAKISSNQERDNRTEGLLLDTGWAVLRFWEHDPSGRVAGRLAAAVEATHERRGS